MNREKQNTATSRVYNNMKPMLPTLKEKKRYIVFEIISDEKIDITLVKKTISEDCLKFLGELGVSRSGLMIISDQFKDNIGVVKANNKYVDEVKTALSLIKKVDNKKVIVNTIGVSGTLKKAKIKFIEKMEAK